MSTVSLDLATSLKTCVMNIMGAEYKEMAYSDEVSLNTFRNCPTQFAVQAGEVIQTSSVTKFLTFTQQFAVVLSKGYCDNGLTDEGSVQASFEMRQKMFELYVNIVNTKAGLPSRVMNVTDLNMASPEYLQDDKVTVLRGTFNITYRLTLL